MQAHDQDELRKQAQRVLTRRIPTNPDRRDEAPPEPEQPRERRRPQEFELPRERQRSREPERPPARVPTMIELAEPRILESASPSPSHDLETMARTERRAISPSSASRVERSAYDVVPPRRSEIYGMLHSRASLRRALIVSEILGRPKALRESSDPENFGGV